VSHEPFAEIFAFFSLKIILPAFLKLLLFN
jgi:hypothetical protein